MALVKAKQIAGGGTGSSGVTSYNDLADKPFIPQSYNDLNDLPTLVSDYSDLANTPPLTKSINFFGELKPTIGTARFTFPKAVTITKIYGLLGETSSDPITAQLKKNGEAVATVTIAATEFNSQIYTTNISVLSTDVLTADITSAFSGKNLTLILVYSS